LNFAGVNHHRAGGRESRWREKKIKQTERRGARDEKEKERKLTLKEPNDGLERIGC
jgi:hypothetical protein